MLKALHSSAFKENIMPIRLLVLLILGISACKARKPVSQIKDEAGRNQPRLESGPSIPTQARSLFDLAMHRTSNPAGKDNVPFPFESLDKYLGSVTSVDRDLNGENKKTSALLIPVGRSLQRFASEPDFFRFPRIVLSPTSWFDASSGVRFL